MVLTQLEACCQLINPGPAQPRRLAPDTPQPTTALISLIGHSPRPCADPLPLCPPGLGQERRRTITREQ